MLYRDTTPWSKRLDRCDSLDISALASRLAVRPPPSANSRRAPRSCQAVWADMRWAAPETLGLMT